MANTHEEDQPEAIEMVSQVNGVAKKRNAYYEAGMVPENALMGDPKGVPIQQAIFRDTPAPFKCTHCSAPSALTTVRSKPSLAAVVGCMIPLMLGFCFLYLSMDCLWHKYHYCPSWYHKVAEFEKLNKFAVMDPSNRLRKVWLYWHNLGVHYAGFLFCF